MRTALLLLALTFPAQSADVSPLAAARHRVMAMGAKIQNTVAEVQKTRELAECMKKKELGKSGC
jgi:hypothetical protein